MSPGKEEGKASSFPFLLPDAADCGKLKRENHRKGEACVSLVFEFGVILGICFAGEALHWLIPLPIPASIYGLVILLVCLLCGVIRESQIKRAAGFLLGIMSMLFVPAAAGLMTQWEAVRRILLPLFIAGIPVTMLVMAATGISVQAVRRGRGNKDD